MPPAPADPQQQAAYDAATAGTSAVPTRPPVPTAWANGNSYTCSGSTIGPPDSEEHQKLVRYAVDREQKYRSQLIAPWQNMIRWWQLYLSKRKDLRDPVKEKWRSNIFVPRPFGDIEAGVALHMDVLTSADPMVQPEGVSDEAEGPARSGMRLLDYGYRKNKFKKQLALGIRAMKVAGTVPFKWTYAYESHKVRHFSTPGEQQEFSKRILEAVQKFAAPPPPDWMQDSAGFAAWRQQVNAAGAQVPEPPYDGPLTVTRYAGPKLTIPSIFELRFDPTVGEVEDMPCFQHRMIVPRKYVLDRAGEGPDKPFCQAAVDFALSSWDGQKLNQYDTQIANALGIGVPTTPGEDLRDMVQLVETWELGTDYPFSVCMNDQAIINKDPTSVPFEHGQCSVSLLRNVQIPGYALGISDLQSPESLYVEKNAHRSLNLDATTLAVLPVFARLTGIGLPDLHKKLIPGAILNVPRENAIQRLVMGEVPQSSWQQQGMIDMDIDASLGLPQSLKGQVVPTGRRSATEAGGTQNNALVRQKLSIITLDEELQPSIFQPLMLFYQFGPESARVRITGQPDTFLTVTRQDVVQCLEMDMRFRGALNLINQDMVNQVMMTFADKFLPHLSPKETRALIKRIYENSGARGVKEIVSEEGTQEYIQMAMEKIALERMQVESQLRMQQVGGIPVPPTVSPAKASAIQHESGAGGAPPPKPQPGGPGGSPPPAPAGPTTPGVPPSA